MIVYCISYCTGMEAMQHYQTPPYLHIIFVCAQPIVMNMLYPLTLQRDANHPWVPVTPVWEWASQLHQQTCTHGAAMHWTGHSTAD